MSLIYYANHSGLEDRVFRLRTGKSAASTPLPRTMHQVSNVRISELEGGLLEVKANWATFYTRHGEAGHFFGPVTYHLRAERERWKIVRKHDHQRGALSGGLQVLRTFT